MERWFTEIDSLAAKMPDYEFLLPIHPNPEIKKHQNIFKFVKVTKHLDHDKLINYLSSCSYVITDSGGLQEESAFLKKPCLVCREETERKEGLGNFSLLCRDPNNLEERFLKLKDLKMPVPPVMMWLI